MNAAGEPPARVLVACVGNIFLGDDGFGVAVARRLAREELPAGVRVEDYGIRALHLAYALAAADLALVLVDAMSRGQPPGTLFVLEPELGAQALQQAAPDAHAMHPAVVLGMARSLGARLSHVYVVGCEPERLDEEMQLSAPVARAVEEAVPLVRELAARLARGERPIDSFNP